MTFPVEQSRVCLRRISMEDAPAITGLLAGDTELALRTATIPIPYLIEDARAFLSTADPEQVFAVMAGDVLTGMIGMLDGADGEKEIGYWIGRIFWGRGYASSAVRLLVEEAQRRGISRLHAYVFPDNPASMRVLEKNGFVRTGEVERDLPKRGGMRRLIEFVLVSDGGVNL
jgi:RimJ/RimL family protein N-acetyltransferase